MVVNQWCKLSVQEVRKRTSKKIQKQKKENNKKSRNQWNRIHTCRRVYPHSQKLFFEINKIEKS